MNHANRPERRSGFALVIAAAFVAAAVFAVPALGQSIANPRPLTPQTIHDAGGMLRLNNLGDVGSVSTARANLGLGSSATVAQGVSVLDPGTAKLESVLPMQTVSGASRTFTAADFFRKTRRTNAGAGMTDTLPASTALGLVNGTRLNIVNVDTTGTLALTAGAGTSLCSSCSSVGPGRDLMLVWDGPNTTWRADANTATALLGANNLSDVSSVSTARTNLGVTATGADTAYAFRANNLSDLASVSTARTNLGVTATGADTAYAFRANNLSDLASAPTARTNLGLGSAATQNTGTSGATVPLLNGANTWGASQSFGVVTATSLALNSAAIGGDTLGLIGSATVAAGASGSGVGTFNVKGGYSNSTGLSITANSATDTATIRQTAAGGTLILSGGNSSALTLASTNVATFSNNVVVNAGTLQVGGATPISTGEQAIFAYGSTGDSTIRVRSGDTGSTGRAGFVSNAYGNSWLAGMGSTANNSNTWGLWLDPTGGNSLKFSVDTSGNAKAVGSVTGAGVIVNGGGVVTLTNGSAFSDLSNGAFILKTNNGLSGGVVNMTADGTFQFFQRNGSTAAGIVAGAGTFGGAVTVGSGAIVSSPSAAVFQHGAADSASPVGQTVQFQNVVAGTTNGNGQAVNVVAPLGTGNGSSGIYKLLVGVPGTSGTAQHSTTVAQRWSSLGTIIAAPGSAGQGLLYFANNTADNSTLSNFQLSAASSSANTQFRDGGSGNIVWTALYNSGLFQVNQGLNLPPVTAPASPSSGWTLYTDSGDSNKLKAKASTGTVITIGTP
jgi:hypothetical protein